MHVMYVKGNHIIDTMKTELHAVAFSPLPGFLWLEISSSSHADRPEYIA